jgi:hypothetical protein
MKILIALVTPSRSLKVIDTSALINSGVEISCIDWAFVQKHNLPQDCLPIPIKVCNVDESTNRKGDILFSTTLFVDIGKVNQKVTFHVMDCGNENIILGLPWLRNTNPTIDWDRQTLTIPESID